MAQDLGPLDVPVMTGPTMAIRSTPDATSSLPRPFLVPLAPNEREA